MHKKRNIFRKIALLPLMGVLLVFISTEISQAATYWVSPTGAAIWSNCSGSIPLNGASACMIGTAFANAGAGDTVNFRGGTYTFPQHTSGDTYSGTFNFVNDGTGDADNQRIIFQSYTGETPIFDGTSGGSGDGVHCFAVMVGTNGHDYITIKGFTWRANGGNWMPRVILGGVSGNYSVGVKFVYNTMNGGPSCSQEDNNEGLRIEDTTNTYVGYNTFYSFIEPFVTLDTTAIKCYFNNTPIFENNEIYNSNGGIYLKHATDGAIIRYNWIHDTNIPIEASTNTGYQTNSSIYHNLIVNCSRSCIQLFAQSASMAGTHIYNNTIYAHSQTSVNTYGALFFQISNSNSVAGAQIYNNIFEVPAGNDYGVTVMLNSSGSAATIIDYNNYSQYIQLGCTAQSNLTTLTLLRAANCWGLTSTNHDQHSLAAASTFTNGSGTLSQIADFALTAASPGYHAGNDGNNLGANVSLVGTGSSSSSKTTDTTPPAIPTNLRIF